MAKRSKNNNNITLTEYGSAECIDGSKTLLNIFNEKILFDVGKDMNKRTPGITFPFNPKDIASLIVGHAHADHMGDLGDFFMQGFRGPIYSTHITADITEMQLMQALSSQYFNKGKSDKSQPKKPQLTKDELTQLMQLFVKDNNSKMGLPYTKNININDRVNISFYEAGHIPGSAQVLFDIKGSQGNITLLTSRDIGRFDYHTKAHPIAADMPLLKFPEKNFPKPIDYLLLECTYGDKIHRPLEQSKKELLDAIHLTAEKGGICLAGTFSIMRNHLVRAWLHEFNKEGLLPKNMTYVMSAPTSLAVDKILLNHTEDLDEKTRKIIKENKYNLFHIPGTVYPKSWKETETMMDDPRKKPMFLMTSSGMYNMGRSVNAAKKVLPGKNNIVLVIGYQSPYTPGYHIKQQEETISFYGEKVPLEAKVLEIHGTSAHADSDESLAHIKHLNPQKGIFLGHGAGNACYAMKQKAVSAGIPENMIHVMKKGQEYVLG
jgi:metallo-beta-lactamase family protein